MPQEHVEQIFFRLLRMALGKEEWDSSLCLAAEDWSWIWSMAVRQAMLGVVFDGVCRLPEGCRPPKEMVLRWFGAVQELEQANRKLNQCAVAVSRKFRQEGFRPVVLKGAGNALWYPQPLHRMPGDIDIWLDGGRERIMAYVRRHVPKAKARYHHVDFPVVKGVEIELHFTPSWLCAWPDNRKLQRWFTRQADEQFAHEVELPEGAGNIAVPTAEMNRIFLLLHIYQHFFDEGIGLRQLMDYALLLEKGCTAEERQTAAGMLDELHLRRFASGIMYILQKTFGLDDARLLVPPSEKEGKFILQEIMQTGNFGQYNTGIRHAEGKTASYFLSKFTYRLRFLAAYPRETLWGYAFWGYQRVYRICKGYV